MKSWIIICITFVSFTSGFVTTNECSQKGRLRKCLQEKQSSVEIITRRNNKYPEYNKHFNLNIHTTPSGFLIPSNAEDVQKIVKCAAQKKVKLSIKCGGYSLEAYSFGNNRTAVIDLRKLNQVVVDKEKMQVTVGAGTLGYDAAKKVMEEGFALPSPVYRGIGVSGFTLGGGYPLMLRSQGLMLQNVIQMKVVTEDGELKTVSETENKDLFFALRGAGHQSFGVVTEFTFKVDPLFNVKYIAKNYAPETFPIMFEKWVELAKEEIDNSVTSAIIRRPSINNTYRAVFFIKNYDEQRTTKVLNQIRGKFPEITDGDIKDVSYSRLLERFTYNYSAGYLKTVDFYVDHPLTNDDRKTLLVSLDKHYTPATHFFIRMLRGKVKENDNNAFIHKDQYFVVGLDLAVPALFPEEKAKPIIDATLPKLKAFIRDTKSLDSGESYQNYEDNDRTDWQNRYFGNEFERLTQLKKQYSPKGVFGCPHCI